jgi:pilus assembly protein Flp/PilA
MGLDVEGKKIMKTFIKMLKDDSGASAAEYALILAIVGAGIAIAAYGLGEAISNSLNATAEEIKGCTSGAAPTSGC